MYRGTRGSRRPPRRTGKGVGTKGNFPAPWTLAPAGGPRMDPLGARPRYATEQAGATSNSSFLHWPLCAGGHSLYSLDGGQWEWPFTGAHIAPLRIVLMTPVDLPSLLAGPPGTSYAPAGREPVILWTFDAGPLDGGGPRWCHFPFLIAHAISPPPRRPARTSCGHPTTARAGAKDAARPQRCELFILAANPSAALHQLL